MKVLYLSLLSLTFAAFLSAQTLDQAIALYDHGKLDESAAAFERLAKANPKSAPAAYWTGRVAFDRGDLERAGAAFESAVELDPKQSDYHLWLGRLYGTEAQKASMLKQISLARKTKSEFELAVQLNPNNLDARSGLIDYYVLAPAIAGGSMDAAREQAAEIAKRDPSRGLRESARIHLLKKEWSEAERIYVDAINRKPDDNALRRDLGFVYQQSKQWPKAYQTFAYVAKSDPSDMQAQYQIGRTAALSGQFLSEGEQAMLRYLQYTPKPDEPPLKWAHMRLGTIYEAEKRAEAARTEYQKALALDPKFTEAKQALAKTR